MAHFHYVMFGGTMFMFIGGLHYWWPKITGRMYNEPLGRLCCLLELLAFNLTFFPQFILGLHGMPRRAAVYFIPSSSTCTSCRRSGLRAAGGVPAHGGLFAALAVPRQEGPGQPLGRLDLGMDLSLAAAARQFPRGPQPSAGLTTTTAWSGTRGRRI